MINVKRWAAGFFLAALLCLPLNAQAALQAQNMRYNDTVDKLRIVVDLNEELKFERVSGQAERITLELGAGTIGRDLKDIILEDDFLRQIKLFTVNKNILLLDIMLREEAPFTAFMLPNPWRLVIDINKDYELRSEDVIAPGLTYTNIRQRSKGRMLNMHFLTLEKSRWTLKPILANKAVLNRDGLKSITYDNNASAAVNASYFGGSGWVIGNLKIGGEIVASEKLPRTALLIDHDLTMRLDFTQYEGSVTLPGGESLPVLGVNRERLANDLVIYQSAFSEQSRSKLSGCDVLLTVDGIVLAVNSNAVSTPFAAGQMVVSAHGSSAGKLARLRPGDHLQINQSMGEPADKASHVIGAGPRLLDTGLIVTARNSENFPPDIMNGRAPRTAAGLKPNGDIVLFVADGRSKESTGLTLKETGEALLAFGVVEAINLDGGGSSEMVIGSRVINVPSDRQERKISVALGVFPHQ